MPQPTQKLAGAEKGALEWNYVKFLVSRDGQAVSRYKPAFTDFEADVSTVVESEMMTLCVVGWAGLRGASG